MENNIAIWRMNSEGEPVIEQHSLRPSPISLDDATERLPGGGYTTFRTFDRFRVLRLESHYLRLEETARLSNHPVVIDRKRVSQALRQALSVYPGKEMRVRIILDLEERPGTVYLLMDTLHAPEPGDYHNGVRVVTRQLQRKNPKAKLTGFIETAAAVRRDLPEGVNEAVMVGEDGRLLEGLSSNFFAVKEGVIWTAEREVLSGITRSLVLEVIREEAIPMKLEGVHTADLPDVEEAFITSASRAVLPVIEIDRKPVGIGHPGQITQQIMRAYQERLEKELERI